MNKINLVFLFLSISILVACVSSRNANIEQGTGYNFQPGQPEFRISALGYIDRNQGPTLTIHTEVAKKSLSFKLDGDSLSAPIALELQIQDIDNSDQVIATRQIQKTVLISKEQKIQSLDEVINTDFSIEVEPGRFLVTAHFQDLNSNKEITQTTEAFIPKIEKGDYALSSIQMSGKQKDQNEWIPVNTYDVKGKMDSLRFIFQVISGQSDKQLKLNSKLVRFESDTGYAREMDRSNYSPSSIEYKGIDFDEETEIQSNQRILTDYSSIFIEYKFENQERGNYQFQVTAQRRKKEENIFKARAFGIKSENYPAIQNARELARPLIYLMSRSEYEDLLSISDPDSLKGQVDRFWLKNIGNSSEAKSVIRLYYNRVEEANKQFSNFKEGWKTDRGMIYILFGSPLYTDDNLKEVIWFYSYNREDPEYSYLFDQPKLKNKFYPFFHYILQRHNFYHTVEYMQRKLWLSGQIITRRL